MIPFIATLVAVASSGLGAHLPSPHDKDGWGIRVHGFSVPGPYIGEIIEHVRFNITLVNFSKETRSHDPLSVAKRAGKLRLRITRPDGGDLFAFSGCGLPASDPFVQTELRPGASTSLDFPFMHFGYFCLGKPGRYVMRATMEIDGKTVAAPVELVVLAVPVEAVLFSHTLPLEGNAATLPTEEQPRPIVRQVKIGDRVALVYVRRLAEFPGKAVDMKVEGAYGAGNPLTITYRETTYTKWTTKLVINSNDGSPWTAEDEKHRQEKLKREGKLPPPDKK